MQKKKNNFVLWVEGSFIINISFLIKKKERKRNCLLKLNCFKTVKLRNQHLWHKASVVEHDQSSLQLFPIETGSRDEVAVTNHRVQNDTLRFRGEGG